MSSTSSTATDETKGAERPHPAYLEVDDIFESYKVPVETSEGIKLVEKHVLSPIRAAERVIDKFRLKMAVGDEKTIWWFDGRIYRNTGKHYVKNAIYKFAANNIDRKELNEVLDRIVSELMLSPVVFNPHPHLLGLQNGVLDGITGEVREYTPEDLITDQIPVSYDPEADCPEICKFIETLTPDEDDRKTLLDFIASGAYRKALSYIGFLLGHGSSGSTKFVELIQAFYGDATTEAIPLTN